MEAFIATINCYTPQLIYRLNHASNHCLFSLSLIPVRPDWSGENHFRSQSTGLHGLVLLIAAVVYFLLSTARIATLETTPSWPVQSAGMRKAIFDGSPYSIHSFHFCGSDASHHDLLECRAPVDYS